MNLGILCIFTQLKMNNHAPPAAPGDLLLKKQPVFFRLKELGRLNLGERNGTIVVD
jgi:hypothetical protein